MLSNSAYVSEFYELDSSYNFIIKCFINAHIFFRAWYIFLLWHAS